MSMSFDLKVSLQPRAEPSAQQKKLNRLIDKIEQQKISLSMWQNAQAEIQQHTRQKLLPVYSELHEILFHGVRYTRAKVFAVYVAEFQLGHFAMWQG